jgi:protocatechuate 3,4-dioxygenase beta subunit
VIASILAGATPSAIYAAQCGVAGAAPTTPQLADVLTHRTEEELVISGRVVGGDCNPIAGAVVQVWFNDPNEVSTAMTDADGRFTLTAKVRADGGDGFNISVTPPTSRTETTRLWFRTGPQAASQGA